MDKTESYKYSTQAIMQKLDINDDEADRIGLHIAKAKPSSKEKKKSRDRRIIDLFNQGFLQKEIAEELKISCSTVSRVINANPGEIDTLSNQIQRLLQSGKTPAEVSRELHCSVRTVERGKISPPKSNTSAHSKCDKNFKNTFIYGLSFRGKGGAPAPSSERSSVVAVDGGRQIKQAIAANDKHSDYFGKIDLYEPFINGSISFTDNDTLANVENTAPARIEAAVLGALIVAEQEGNLYISCVKLRNHVNGFLQYYSALVRSWTPLTARQVSDACNTLCQKGMVVADQSASEGVCYFLVDNHTHEKEVAELLTALINSQPRYRLAPVAIFQAVRQYEAETGFTLSREQQGAILLALTEPVAIITGGPGTGKTATMAALCHVLKNIAPKAHIELCAPTGKATVHLSAVTGTPAKTIHSLKRRKINCDFLIVDEASMVDMALLHDMLKMISKGAHVLFVGDSNQLPCIGGGNALRDMINCKRVPTVSLNQVYRQSEQNGIVSYANMIWAKQESTLFPQSSSINNDICFIRLQEASEIAEKVAKIVESLKNMGNLDSDIQVLTPTREWARNLNLRLKSIFNPVPNEQKSEPFSIGDRIIYTENNYARKLHNGQEGMVSSVAEKTITVCYGGQTMRHAKADMERLELSYALTIHKAQGSEYPVVIIPVHTSMGRALNKNMIYTAVTRARRKCIIVGSEQALRMALDTTLSDTHRSLLAERLSQT